MCRKLPALALISLLLAIVADAGWHQKHDQHRSHAWDLQHSSSSSNLLRERVARILLQEDSALQSESGFLVVRALSLGDGGDEVAYLLRRADNAHILELVVENEALLRGIAPGTHITVHGRMAQSGDELLVMDVAPATATGAIPSTSQPTGAANVAELIAAPASTAALRSKAQSPGTATGDSSLPVSGSVANLASTSNGAPWSQKSVVTQMSVLVMMAAMCGQAPAAAPQDVQRVLFDGPGSQPQTLQGYFAECSRGKALLNSSNSKVVGPIPIPCSYNSSQYNFTADNCAYSDSDGWHVFAQQYAKNTLGVDIDAYQHRVLVMPRYYSMSYANCRWIGQGTLGPDVVSETGQYLSSKVWLSGEYWNIVTAYMHELGHTNYLHHAIQGECPYCDGSCLMGSCCDVRCFNAPHNWQLGWSTPLATLTSSTLPAATWVNFSLPAQQLVDQSVLMIQPDWSQSYLVNRAYSWFISYRIDSGKYDAGLSGDYTFLTNIYWWDGLYQTMPIMTRYIVGLYNGDEFRNTTDMLVVRQLSSGTGGALVSVCRMTQLVESLCHDGLDNDCDGLIDNADHDCNPSAPSVVPPMAPPSPPDNDYDYYFPPPNPFRPPHPPSPPPPSPPPLPSPPQHPVSPPSPPPLPPSAPPPSLSPPPNAPRFPILTLSPPPPPPTIVPTPIVVPAATLPQASPANTPKKGATKPPPPLPKWKKKPPPPLPPTPLPPLPKKGKKKPPPLPPKPSPPKAAAKPRGLRQSTHQAGAERHADDEMHSQFQVDWQAGQYAAGAAATSAVTLDLHALLVAGVQGKLAATPEWRADWSEAEQQQEPSAEQAGASNLAVEGAWSQHNSFQDDGSAAVGGFMNGLQASTRVQDQASRPGVGDQALGLHSAHITRVDLLRQRLALAHRNRGQDAPQRQAPLIKWWEQEGQSEEAGQRQASAGGWKSGL